VKKVYSLAFYRHNASGYESERAGVAKGIFFVNFFPTMIRAFHIAYPGWQMWIHHDERVRKFPYFNSLERMDAAGLLKLVPMGKAETLCGSMLWRLNPIWEEDVEYVACRDVDSFPMHRDYNMLNEFVGYGSVAHAILDSESHCGPLMGGMVAFRAPSFKRLFPGFESLKQLMLLKSGIDLNIHGSDQTFLNQVIWPHVQESTIIHQILIFQHQVLMNYPYH
jgi:hypothetical protein